MDLFQIFADSAWFGALTALVGSGITYFITRNNNKKEITINDRTDRMQLSKDQYQLISELREMVGNQRDEIETMRDEMKTLQIVNLDLIFQNKELKIQNDALQNKMGELSDKLDTFINNKGEDENGSDTSRIN